MRKVINNQLIIDEKPVGYFCFGKFVKPVRLKAHVEEASGIGNRCLGIRPHIKKRADSHREGQ